MTRRWKAGEGNLDGILILAVLIVIVIAMPRGEGGESFLSTAPGTAITSSSASSNPNTSNPTLASSIYIGSGNASYSYQAYEEYITIDNSGRTPIDITNWQLKNGKDTRPYDHGGSLQRFSADVAVIPQGVAILSPAGNNALQNIVLGEYERAIITTGSPTVQSPYKIVSFKENMCTGYLEALTDYSFTPALTQNCPQPRLEPGIEGMAVQCRDFINTLPSCQTPKFGGKDRDSLPCSTCVNGTSLTSTCANFIKAHFNFQGCMANHRNDSGFSSRTWRVFLGRGWEMWADKYETIEVFDQFGKLVNFQNY